MLRRDSSHPEPPSGSVLSPRVYLLVPVLGVELSPETGAVPYPLTGSEIGDETPNIRNFVQSTQSINRQMVGARIILIAVLKPKNPPDPAEARLTELSPRSACRTPHITRALQSRHALAALALVT